MFIKDLLFPKVCLSCGKFGSYICLECYKKLDYMLYDKCIYCEKNSFAGFTHPGCRRRNGVDGLLTIFHYNDVLKKIIKSIKYRLVREGLIELLTIIEPQATEKIGFYKKHVGQVYLQPIPLHDKRLKQRGFNQSAYIVNVIAHTFGWPAVELLHRTKETQSQARLSGRENRYLNMRGAFSISKKNSNAKKIILVDDVVTSGSTVKEAARTLKTNGAEKVYILALAKG